MTSIDRNYLPLFLGADRLSHMERERLIFVTGATGFIGKRWVQDLLRTGYRVRVSVRTDEGLQAFQSLSHASKLEVLKVDLFQSKDIDRCLEGVEALFHLAGKVTAWDEASFMEANSLLTERLVQGAIRARSHLKHFVHISSLAAAGPSAEHTPRVESAPDGPVSAYGRSKLAGERQLESLRGVLPVTIVRPPMVYGPGDRGLLSVVKMVQGRVVPYLKGRHGKWYSSVHVDDLIQGFHKILARPQVFELYYLASKEIIRFEAILAAMAGALQTTPLLIPAPRWMPRVLASMSGLFLSKKKPVPPLNWDKVSEIHPDFWTCDAAKARKELGWDARIEMQTGIGEVIRWYQNQGWITGP
jgi:dihydroflavonol-4-reductase